MNLESAMKDVLVRLKVHHLDAFEVVGLDENLLTVEAKQQMVERMQRAKRVGLSIRTIKDGRLGFASTKDLSVRSVHQALRSALDSMANVEASADAVIPSPQDAADAFEEASGRQLSDVSDEEKISIAKCLESTALACESKVRRVQHPRYEEIDRRLIVMNSEGTQVSAQRSMASCELRVIAEDDDAAQSSYDFGYSVSFDRLDANAVARRAARRAVAKLGARSVPGGRFPVVFTPRAAACMVRLIAPSFFADNIQRGKSVLSGKLGERSYTPQVTLVDDGLLPDGFGSFAFDWEGVPKRRTTLVQDGVVASWLYDGARAAHDGVSSTGNSHRDGLGKLPHVGVNNCFLKAGSQSPNSIISGVSKGILATDLLGLHTANIISGEFSLGIEGFTIEDGVAGRPIRGMTVAGNIHDLFRSVVAVGNDLEFFATYGSPTVMVEGLMLGS